MYKCPIIKIMDVIQPRCITAKRGELPTKNLMKRSITITIPLMVVLAMMGKTEFNMVQLTCKKINYPKPKLIKLKNTRSNHPDLTLMIKKMRSKILKL